VVGIATLVAATVYLLWALVIRINESKAPVASQAFHYQHSFEWDDLMIGGDIGKCTAGADRRGRTVKDVGLRPFACWNRGFESRRWHGCLSVVIVLWSQVEASALG